MSYSEVPPMMGIKVNAKTRSRLLEEQDYALHQSVQLNRQAAVLECLRNARCHNLSEPVVQAAM